LIELVAEGRSWIKPDLWAAQRNAPAAKAQEHVREVFNPQTDYQTETAAPEVEVISVFGADTLQKVGNFKNKVSYIAILLRFEARAAPELTQSNGARRRLCCAS
jgi:hypothetical protein